MSITDIIVVCVFLYFAFCIIRFILVTVWTVLVWAFAFIDPSYKGRLRRIVRRTKAQHKAIGEVFESEMRRTSEAAAKDILRR